LGITQSMGGPRSTLDNAVIETWHSTLSFELHGPAREDQHSKICLDETGDLPRMSDALRLLRRPETALAIVPGSSSARWLRVRGRQARC
jgi:transposase InsO family protein